MVDSRALRFEERKCPVDEDAQRFFPLVSIIDSCMFFFSTVSFLIVIWRMLNQSCREMPNCLSKTKICEKQTMSFSFSLIESKFFNLLVNPIRSLKRCNTLQTFTVLNSRWPGTILSCDAIRNAKIILS